MSIGPASGAAGLQARLQASQAALRELQLLRQKHGALVQDAKDAFNNSGKRNNTSTTSTKPAKHPEPQQYSRSTCCYEQASHTKTISDPARIRGTVHTNLLSDIPNDVTNSQQLAESNADTEIAIRGCRNLSLDTSSSSGPTSTPVAPPRHRSRSQSSSHPFCPCCRSRDATPLRGQRSCSDSCVDSVTSPYCDRHAKAHQEKDFTAPRLFSNTTYNYPSPMHAVLLQYHWTRQTDMNMPDSRQQTSYVDHCGKATDACDLPFMFLSEQTKPENNSLHNLLQTSYTELAENYDNFDATPSNRSSLDSSRSVRISSSSEEGYYSSSDSPTASLAHSDHMKRCSGQSDISFSSTGSDACSMSSDILSDLPSSSSIKSLKPTRISGVDDSWIDCLDQLSNMKDTFV